jgi:hypothetical protein
VAELFLSLWLASLPVGAAIMIWPQLLRPFAKEKPVDRVTAFWISAALSGPLFVVAFTLAQSAHPSSDAKPSTPQPSRATPKASPETSQQAAPKPPKVEPNKEQLQVGDKVRFPKGLLACDSPDIYIKFAQAAANNDKASAMKAYAGEYGATCSVLPNDETFEVREVHYTEPKMPGVASVAVVPPDVSADWPPVYGLVLDRSFWKRTS